MIGYKLRILVIALFFFILHSSFSVTSASALLAEVPETGQNAAYANGDDGDLKPGFPWPTPRFTENGNGTVTDNLTGLIWLQNANCSATLGGIVKTTTLTWTNALAWSNALASGSCGLTDGSTAGQWRLPNRKELQSLVDVSSIGPALPEGHPFTDVQSGDYWSSSTYSGRNDYGLYIYMPVGFLSSDWKGYYNYVWPVRGGQFGNSVISVSPSFVSYGNVSVSQSSSQTVSVSNTSGAGSSRLQINAITLRGTDPGQFSINPGNGDGGTCGSTTPILNPGASCTVEVSFNPTSAGARSASLRISGSDVNAPNTDISLTGTGGSFYNVTGSVSDGNGTISSSNPASVTSGSTAAFTLAPNATYQPASSVTGTCPTGSWNGNTYTTGAITADCSVGFSFVKTTYPLTITYYGRGTGTVIVTPKPQAIDCTGTCSQSFDSGTVVSLTVNTDFPSTFNGWNDCFIIDNVCTFTMSEAKSLEIYFGLWTDNNIKAGTSIMGGSINSAWSSLIQGGEIRLKADTFYENVTFYNYSNGVYNLKGGYNDDFSSIISTSTIYGVLVIGAGTVIVENIVIM